MLSHQETHGHHERGATMSGLPALGSYLSAFRHGHFAFAAVESEGISLSVVQKEELP